MSTAPVTSKLAVVTAGEPTLFDSLARLVPEDLQAAYYRVLAHTRTLSPDDEMLRILEAMGILALLSAIRQRILPMSANAFRKCLICIGSFRMKRSRKCSAMFTNWRRGFLLYPAKLKPVLIRSKLQSSWARVCDSTFFNRA